MSEDSNDSKQSIFASSPTGQLVEVKLEQIKAAYIVEGLSATELSSKFNLPAVMIDRYISENQLDKLRAAHIKHGISQLQNIQVAQAEKLMQLESQFKKIRIIQLEKILDDHMAYYAQYGHFYKVHPNTKEILKDTNGIPMQIKLPNVSAEIAQLKETVSLSEGLKQILGQIDDILHRPKDVENLNQDVIDVTSYSDLFSKRKRTEEDDE